MIVLIVLVNQLIVRVTVLVTVQEDIVIVTLPVLAQLQDVLVQMYVHVRPNVMGNVQTAIQTLV